MVKTKFKRAVSLVMAAVLSLGVFTNIGTTAYAASGTKSDVYIMQLPRSGDTNNNGKWGHGELKFMNGWYSHAISTDSLRAMGSYSGNIAYCIEPGTGQHTGDTLTEKNEDYFNNLGSNGTISGDDIRLNIGRILQYGYCGNISTSWKSQNSDDADLALVHHVYLVDVTACDDLLRVDLLVVGRVSHHLIVALALFVAAVEFVAPDDA